MIDDAKQKVGQIKLEAPAGTLLVADGARIDDDVLFVLPGDHVFEGRFGDKMDSRSSKVLAGQSLVVRFEKLFDAPAGASPPPTTPIVEPHTELPPPASDPPGTIWKPLTFVLGGAALLAGGVAIYANGKSRGHADDATSIGNELGTQRCGVPGAPAKCADLQKALDDQGSAADVSKGFWVGASVLLVATGASAVLWFTNAKSTSGTITPVVGPGTAGAFYHIAF